MPALIKVVPEALRVKRPLVAEDERAHAILLGLGGVSLAIGLVFQFLNPARALRRLFVIEQVCIQKQGRTYFPKG